MTMTKQEMKQAVIRAIDESVEELYAVRDSIYHNPEYGYKEVKTTATAADYLESLGLDVTRNIAVTGCKAKVNGEKKGPHICVMGELDGITCKEHKDANEIGASHTCGHFLQMTGLLGAATGLVKSGVLNQLDGQITFMAVPAEEFIELEYREGLKKDGKIKFFGGKQELIYRGEFDDVDMAMMFHSQDLGDMKAILGTESNGFVGKKIHFIGKEAHAGSAPYEGINALNAAMLAINNVHALRETFKESERARFHPILTKGGDIVNVVPADVTMEAYVRARTIEGMADINSRINRAILAGGMAVGAQVEITEIPGYLPILSHDNFYDVMRENLKELGLDGKIIEGGDFTGSFDFGDLSCMMPAIHPMIGGITGALHTRDFKLVDSDLACIVPAKAMAMTVIDLLYDNAQGAKEILKDFKPLMTKEEYLAFQEQNDRTITLN